jgi:hypothetical protein
LGCYYGVAVGTYVNSEALELRDNIEAIEETQQIRPALGVIEKFVIKREALFIRKHDMGPEANWTKRACLLSCCFNIDRVTFQYQMNGCFNLLGTETTKRIREFSVVLWTCFAFVETSAL